jgi:hypothetical protein
MLHSEEGRFSCHSRISNVRGFGFFLGLPLQGGDGVSSLIIYSGEVIIIQMGKYV